MLCVVLAMGLAGEFTAFMVSLSLVALRARYLASSSYIYDVHCSGVQQRMNDLTVDGHTHLHEPFFCVGCKRLASKCTEALKWTYAGSGFLRWWCEVALELYGEDIEWLLLRIIAYPMWPIVNEAWAIGFRWLFLPIKFTLPAFAARRFFLP